MSTHFLSTKIGSTPNPLIFVSDIEHQTLSCRHPLPKPTFLDTIRECHPVYISKAKPQQTIRWDAWGFCSTHWGKFPCNLCTLNSETIPLAHYMFKTSWTGSRGCGYARFEQWCLPVPVGFRLSLSLISVKKLINRISTMLLTYDWLGHLWNTNKLGINRL